MIMILAPPTAVEELDWLLPTDIQAESIPLILGGGDELMSAETGSGKTGAFSMPVIQIVYETLKDEQEGKTGRASIKTGKCEVTCLCNDLGVAFEIPQQLKSQPFFASCVLKNAELKFNSGGEDFKNAPKSGSVAMYQAPRSQIYSDRQ
ncbi:hypothetical protein KUCAC02_019559 [Chaenocephalus aceratus]|uniref:Uncharacterized protein n=1 Tax=Chaenocephalus aceratus TaxID=36190 RepID=A0ACB9VNZ4_CHAAC|nr:hypothetical protein KUCAC02_019559 [Chaenocephalus aceratus]